MNILANNHYQMEDDKTREAGHFKKIHFKYFLLTNSNPNLVQSKKKMFYYIAYTINIFNISLNLILNFVFQIILDNINFVKVKISSPNTKSETQN